MSRVTGRLATFVLLCAAVALAGCAAPSPEGSGQGYVSGDGTITEFPLGERGEAISFSGPTEDGSTFTSTDYSGQVLVVNFWYASCPPCRVEAPWLNELANQFDDQGVTFVGVNVRDSAATASAFARSFDVPYPSIIDRENDVMAAFAGRVSPGAVPTTIVLDHEGRPTSRIIGLIDQDVLEELIVTAIDELPERAP